MRRDAVEARAPVRGPLLAGWRGVLLCAALVSGCRESAAGALEKRFRISIPPGTTVEHFDCSGPGMDHRDVWVLSPASDSLVGALVRSGRLARRREGDRYSGGLISTAWPEWWPAEALEALPIIYHGVDSAAKHQYRRVWVDTSGKRVYVQFFTT